MAFVPSSLMELAVHARYQNSVVKWIVRTVHLKTRVLVDDHRDGECVRSIATTVGCCSVCVSAFVLISVVIIVARNDFYV